MSVYQNKEEAKEQLPAWMRKRLPIGVRRSVNSLYWHWYDFIDFGAEIAGLIPSHTFRLWFYRHILKVSIGSHTSIHRGCRFYNPSGVSLGNNIIINRNVLLDGRMGLHVGDNTSISEGSKIFTLEHDPNSVDFESRGGKVSIGDRVFIGASALMLPGVSIGEGAVVAAGAIVTEDVAPYNIVAGVPARVIGRRRQDLKYSLHYQKFLG